MANKRYDQFATTAPTTTRILLTADPATGVLGKCTTQAVLNLQTPSVDVIAALQSVGSPIKTTVWNTNPLVFGGAYTPSFQALYFWMMYIPAATYTGVWYIQTTIGSFSILGYNGFALYSQSAGTLTQVAICTTDVTRWKSGSPGFFQAPFVSATALTAGVYWLAFLYTGGAASPPPTFVANVGTYPNVTNSYGMSNSLNPLMSKGGQTAMPGSIVASTLGVGAIGTVLCGLY